MKKLLLLPIYHIAVSLLIPFLIYHPTAKSELSNQPPLEENTTQKDETINVFNPSSDTTEPMSMTDYITGVVAAEMPASFESEALKAQAVAARTYAIYKTTSSDHPNCVCTDFSHCQAFMTTEQMHSVWKDDYNAYYSKIKDSVIATKNEHLVYNSEPVMAVFHSMGGGYTENSEDVWGTSVPYLVSVESPGEESAANYRTNKSVSFEEFKNTIKSAYPNISISSPADVSSPILTDGGHVKSIIIGSISVPGTKMRSLFNLRSTKFDLSFENGNVIFSVTGYGHGVGMSQYGANAMAKEGKTYKEILSHYYSGTTIEE